MAEDAAPETDAAVAEASSDAEFRMSLSVDIEDVGPCKKHIKVSVPRGDIDHFRGEAIDELSDKAEVPGFRVGHVPHKLLERRFKEEITDQIKQKVLVMSLEQLADDHDLDPINEPNLDIEDLEIPEDGDFEYEFEVEVRPEFDLPDYAGLKIERPARDISDDDIEAYKERFLAQYGERKSTDEPAVEGDFISAGVTFSWNDNKIHEISEFTVRLRPTLRFQDAEVDEFGKLLAGVKPGDERDVNLKVSIESSNVEMRGETVTATFKVNDVKRLEMPELNKEFFDRIGVEDESELNNNISSTLERQVTYEQRQSTRDQVLDHITASADWDLPEELVLRQTENALRREILEMQQAGFTTQEITARENEIRQQAVSTTREALKQHFVLDRIADTEEIEVTNQDIESEILLMSFQSGESPRRVRARLTKSGLIENLEAQIRERKAVDVILDKADFTDVDMPAPTDTTVEAVPHSVCGLETAATPAE